MKINNPFKKLAGNTKFRHGGLATGVTAIFIAGIIVLNVIAGLLVSRFDLSVDMTATRAFDLSSDTTTLIGSVKIPVKIIILAKESDFTAIDTYFAQANEVINLYAKKNSNITVEYADPVKNPAVLTKYSDLGASTDYIVVESALRKVLVNPNDLFTTDDYGKISGSKVEYAMSTALLSVTTQSQPTISFLTGHGEEDMSALQSFLTSNNFKAETKYLSTEGLDPEASVVVIGAPTNDYTADDLKKLDSFLYNNGNYGKNIIYYASAGQGSLPNLESFLKNWGIQVGTGFVYETDKSKSYTDGTNLYAVNSYTDTTFAGTLANKTIFPAIAYSRPLTQAASSTGAKTVKTLLSFSATSVVAPLDVPKDWDPSSQTQSANPSIIMGTTTVYQGDKTLSSNVVAVGSTSFVSNTLLHSTSFTNGEYTLTLFNKVINREDTVPLLSKSLGGTSIDITANQANILTILFLVITPVAVLITGLYVWIRRRHL